MNKRTIEIGGVLYSCLVSPIALKVVGKCNVTKEVFETDNGFQNKEYLVDNVKLFENSIEHINIIAIGYDKCNKFINGKCYQDSTILGFSENIPNVFNQTLVMYL